MVSKEREFWLCAGKTESTVQSTHRFDTQDIGTVKKKPQAITAYDTMEGTDLTDQHHTPPHPPHKLQKDIPQTIFLHLVNCLSTTQFCKSLKNSIYIVHTTVKLHVNTVKLNTSEVSWHLCKVWIIYYIKQMKTVYKISFLVYI